MLRLNSSKYCFQIKSNKHAFSIGKHPTYIWTNVFRKIDRTNEKSSAISNCGQEMFVNKIFQGQFCIFNLDLKLMIRMTGTPIRNAPVMMGRN